MSAPPSPTLSDSALLDSLQDDPRFDLAAQREARLEALQQQVRKVQTLQTSEYGKVITYGDEKALLMRMAKEKYCLIHFFHPEFARCRIMDAKLEELAPKYTHTLFLRASVTSVPFSVVKFGVQVLPNVHIFVDGRCVDRLIGFEDLNHDDNFTTSALEWRLKQSGALPTGDITLANSLAIGPAVGKGNRDGDGSDDESDHDDAARDRRGGGKGKGRGVGRKGKVGIRDGFAGGLRDDDEWA